MIITTCTVSRFLSTLSLRRATTLIWDVIAAITISIHALLAESDPGKVKLVEPGLVFLSTLSLRRATSTSDKLRMPSHYFYPRSPCGERRNTKNNCIDYSYFYPRSPCGERQPGARHANSQQEFLSTLSLRRATAADISASREASISIHALLAESDSGRWKYHNTIFLFLSTLSLRRATSNKLAGQNCKKNFYPRSPCGERLRLYRLPLITLSISIHALLAESDRGRQPASSQS